MRRRVPFLYQKVRRLDIRKKMSEYELSATEIAMEKRDRFIAELRQEAKVLGLSFRVSKSKGKGGHAMVFLGDRFTTLPSREIDPKTAVKIRKALGLR